jgi:hypothetical protein
MAERVVVVDSEVDATLKRYEADWRLVAAAVVEHVVKRVPTEFRELYFERKAPAPVCGMRGTHRASTEVRVVESRMGGFSALVHSATAALDGVARVCVDCGTVYFTVRPRASGAEDSL